MRAKERITISSGNGSVTIEPSGAPSWYYRPVTIVDENVNGDKVVIHLRSKVRISFSDLLEPEAKNALDYVLQGGVVSVKIEYLEPGSQVWRTEISVDNAVVLPDSKQVSREALLYNYSVEFEEQ